jgi:hypothetical protein
MSAGKGQETRNCSDPIEIDREEEEGTKINLLNRESYGQKGIEVERQEKEEVRSKRASAQSRIQNLN